MCFVGTWCDLVLVCAQELSDVLVGKLIKKRGAGDQEIIINRSGACMSCLLCGLILTWAALVLCSDDPNDEEEPPRCGLCECMAPVWFLVPCAYLQGACGCWNRQASCG